MQRPTMICHGPDGKPMIYVDMTSVFELVVSDVEVRFLIGTPGLRGDKYISATRDGMAILESAEGVKQVVTEKQSRQFSKSMAEEIRNYIA